MRRSQVQLGTSHRRCGSCQQMADLTLVEIRPRRQLRDLFRRDLDLRVDRRIRCSACGRSYPSGAGV